MPYYLFSIGIVFLFLNVDVQSVNIFPTIGGYAFIIIGLIRLRTYSAHFVNALALSIPLVTFSLFEWITPEIEPLLVDFWTTTNVCVQIVTLFMQLWFLRQLLKGVYDEADIMREKATMILVRVAFPIVFLGQLASAAILLGKWIAPKLAEPFINPLSWFVLLVFGLLLVTMLRAGFMLGEEKEVTKQEGVSTDSSL